MHWYSIIQWINETFVNLHYVNENISALLIYNYNI